MDHDFQLGFLQMSNFIRSFQREFFTVFFFTYTTVHAIFSQKLFENHLMLVNNPSHTTHAN